MTGTLLVEIQLPGQDWQPGVALAPQDGEGSISDICGPDARHIILFRCQGETSVVARSTGGMDFTEGLSRYVLAEGRELLAELADGQSYEQEVTSDSGVPYRARWTHRDYD
jgi:hypothetical protein